MTRYIAFLRAINVGGRMVKMEDLRKHMALPGFKNITTYIQSGNVLFDTTETNVDVLVTKIEAKLLKALGYEVKTLIRTIPQLESIIKKCPFKNVPEDMALHLSMLSATPDKTLVSALLELQTDNEQFRVAGEDIYILVKKGAYGETKFSNTFLEKKLKVAATTRNWATINKMTTYTEDQQAPQKKRKQPPKELPKRNKSL